MDSGSRPNPGDTVNIVVWFLLVSSVLATVARFLTKRALHRHLSTDDSAVLVALAFSVGQAIAISMEVANGLGKPIKSLPDAEITRQLKSAYASDLCFIPAICVSEVSVLLLVKTLTPVKAQKHLAFLAGCFIIIYGLTGILVVSFRCALPRPYDPIDNKCLSWVAFDSYFCVAVLATELVLVLLPLQIIWGLQLNMKRKLTILVCFAGRSLVMAAVICQLFYLNHKPISYHSTFSTWEMVLSKNAVQNGSIITACVPCLKPLLKSLETGMMKTKDLRQRQGYYLNLEENYRSCKLSDTRANPSLEPSSLNSGQNLSSSAPASTAYAVKIPSDLRGLANEKQEESSKAIRTVRTWAVDTVQGSSNHTRST